MKATISLTSRPQSRRSPLLLLLVALFVILAAAQGMAQMQPEASVVLPQTLQAPASTADFLASLSAAPAGAQNDLMPSPVLDSGCTSSAQCPKGQLCCLACGYAGCDTRACFVPMNGHCPFFP